jgi:dihydroorotate dehydrogenase
MDWDLIIRDFRGLANATVKKSSRGIICRELNHDKTTINRWLESGYPNDPRDVGALIRLALKKEVEVDPFQTFDPICDFRPMLSYEEKVELGPPPLIWLADPGIVLPEFTVDLCGLKSDSPLGIASSPLMADERWASLMLNLGYGISTLKTRRTRSKPAWDPPHVAFVLDPPPLIKYDSGHPPEVEVTFNRAKVSAAVPNLVNSLGVPSDCPAEWQSTYEKIKGHTRGGLVGLSVISEGETDQEMLSDIDFGVASAADVHPPFIEINISCPNLEKKLDPYENLSLVKDICSHAKRIAKPRGILVVLKLPLLPDGKLKSLLESTGKIVDVVSFRNTLRVQPLTRDREGHLHPAFTGRQFAGLSGPCTFQTTLRGIKSITKIKSQLRQHFGIIAIGGVASYSDVIELMNAGADLVQACTTPIFDPLLALKVRYHLSNSSPILKRKQDAFSATGGLLLPRDQIERESFRELENAVAEIERRFPDRQIPYSSIVATWNPWMSTRSAGIDIGAARRVAIGKKKADWIKDLL